MQQKLSIQEITPQFIREAIRGKHPNHTLTCDLAKSIRIHAEGEFPAKLIDVRRPSEAESTFKYRKDIYEPITKETIGKVITELQKIRRSQDWNIAYNDDEIPKIIPSEETLEKYCEETYPGYASLTNWAFAELLERYLVDANSIVAMILAHAPASSNEYIKPVTEVFSSDQVHFYEEDNYVVLKSADKNMYKGGNNQTYQGDIFYIITTTHILKYKQTASQSFLELDYSYGHKLGYLPAFKVGGKYKQRVNNDTIYESRISYMVPSLNEAAREYSDLQAEIVQHIHSEKYYYANTECPACIGRGVGKGNKGTCTKCDGRGQVPATSPYGTYIIDAQRAGDLSVPTPPVGYIQKDTKIAELQDARIDKHLYKALASINMEFLSDVQLNQSGVAKEVDRDALNTFVNSIAEDIVRVLDRIYHFICDVRYSTIIPNDLDRAKLRPSIAVPEKFDILNSNYFMEEMAKANESRVSPTTKKYLELEFARKRYNSDPSKADELECILEMDPFFSSSQDDKMTMLANDGISHLDYVISCNINQFVYRATQEHESFYRKAFEEKLKILEQYANDLIASNALSVNIDLDE